MPQLALPLDAMRGRCSSRYELRAPGANRLLYVADAFRAGWSRARVGELTHIDPWFLAQIEDLVAEEAQVRAEGLGALDAARLRALKRKGFSDSRLATPDVDMPEKAIRDKRHELGVVPVYKRVDTCAAEFATSTAYLYSTYEEECEAEPTDKRKIMILGGGPNRIGQGIEFDYCCVHAALAAARGWLRDHHGQLQPGDRLDRLRHLRPALLRAADARGRARGTWRRKSPKG